MRDFRKNLITDVINQLDYSNIITIWNDYCTENNYFENRIYDNDSFTIDDIFGNYSPYELLTDIDRYNSNDPYFIIGDHGITSFNTDELDEFICITDLVNGVIREPSILTNTVSEFDEDYAMKEFESYISSLNLPIKINWRDMIDSVDLIVNDWSLLVEDLIDEYM